MMTVAERDEVVERITLPLQAASSPRLSHTCVVPALCALTT